MAASGLRAIRRQLSILPAARASSSRFNTGGHHSAGLVLVRYSSSASTDSSSSSSSSSSDLAHQIKDMSFRAYDVLGSGVQKWSSASPGMVSASISVASCAAAWMLLPRLLRKVHKYVQQAPTARLLGHEEQPYEVSVWSALEDPTRLFVTVVAFSQIAAVVAPSTVAEQYLGQIWNGGLVVSGLWFLHRWKSIAFSRKLLEKATSKDDQERYMALDKLSSVAIIMIGAMSLAETLGVAVQSILTVGGIGGVATAFAAKDILGNALSGLFLQFLKPFSVGDAITAGNIEGQVTEIGLHSTYLLNADKFPIVVPNSFFSSQVIVNKSRASKLMIKSRIYISLAEISKVPAITSKVVDYLKTHPRVKYEQEPPLCYISRFNPASLEITINYEIRPTKKQEILALEQEVLVKAAEIFKTSGAELGAPDLA